MALSKKFIFGLTGVFLLHHAVLWFLAAYSHGISWFNFLHNWDAGWYNQIIQEGYTAKRLAFFPLYPLIIRFVAFLTGLMSAPHIAGAVFSTCLFLIFCALIAYLPGKRSFEQKDFLFPTTSMGWFLFLYQPGSFIFHSHHTESLFLMLSFLSFYFVYTRRYFLGSVFGGLCSITRIQGVFVVATAALNAFSHKTSLSNRCVKFAGISIVGALFFAAFLVYQYQVTGDFLSFVHSQTDWNHPTSSLEIFFKTFVLANPWQGRSIGAIAHYVFFLITLLSLPFLLRSNWQLAVYVALSDVVMLPLEGEFVNNFRFATVLFPLWFWWGEKAQRLPKWAKVVLILVMVFLNHEVTRGYVIARWSY